MDQSKMQFAGNLRLNVLSSKPPKRAAHFVFNRNQHLHATWMIKVNVAEPFSSGKLMRHEALVNIFEVTFKQQSHVQNHSETSWISLGLVRLSFFGSWFKDSAFPLFANLSDASIASYGRVLANKKHCFDHCLCSNLSKEPSLRCSESVADPKWEIHNCWVVS